jgi:GNAT superfamily N-acetyltransferase
MNHSTSLTMSATVRLATSSEELQRLYRFRYEIYVEEMGRPQKHADHEARTIIEPLDQKAHQFLAEDDQGRVIGTLRTNFGGESLFGDYHALYGMDCLGEFPLERVSITTKFMVRPEYRRGTLGIRLAREVYRFCLLRGILVDFIDCNVHLETVFEGLGYRRYRSRVLHPEYGDVLPMVLLLTDLEHFDAVGSPFARICRESCLQQAARRLLQPGIQAFHLQTNNQTVAA